MRNIPSPFDPAEFRKEGHQIVELLADYLNDALSGKQMPVLPDNDPDELADRFSFGHENSSKEPLQSFVKKIIDNSIHIHHPHYAGHQVTSPFPLAALVQFCTTLLNNGAAIYEMGPVNMAMERNVVRKISELVGFPPGSDGILTHGGTAGNLTAMLAARQAKTDYNIWESGVQAGNRPGYLASEQAHYSVARNIKIMGLGDDCAIKVPCDNEYRMKAGALEESYKKAIDKGVKIISVVASSCSTATGSYDNLNDVADFCSEHDLWLHVDGAHGMGVLFSEKYRKLVSGIERADSVVIDFHKMFLVPALNTLVLFRDGERSYETFAQKASYLFHKSQENVWYNSAIRTIECTKSALGIIAYTAIKYYGDDYYRSYIESRYDLARNFGATVRDSNDLELVTMPQSNIVCFRFRPDGYDELLLNKINAGIRKSIVKSGKFYIVQAELEGKTWLRMTLLNPVTDIDDLNDLISLVRSEGYKLIGS